MAISIDWETRVITIPRVDMPIVQASPEIRELDLNAFRTELNDLQDDIEGIPYPTTHQHTPPTTIGGADLARVVELINGYTVTFENGSYRVNLTGANSNVLDVANYNSVQIAAANSAGLVNVEGSGGGTGKARIVLS